MCTSNIGVWVGDPFRNALQAKFASKGYKVHVQGVNPEDYPADLSGYLTSGAPESCAWSLGRAVERYHRTCPKAKIVISGWR